jgi:valyl-tRNA synthetase
LSNIRDWCISRQLWWGHRIPVWYCSTCGEMLVPRTDPDHCSKGHTTLAQDPDVLDTWFSSWLWPFSTLGWPEETPDLKRFYPTTTLVTAYDIIFFWVARMIMAGMEFMGQAPFRDVYIHGLVRDKQGRKMSKSLGNGIDPLEIIAEYGADAFRFTLAFMAAQGQDILLDKESFKIGSKFANKLWNAARYILMNAEGRKLVPLSQITLNEADRWILHRLNETARTLNEALSNYRFNDATQNGYEFFWNDFCDWYIEASKLSLYSKDENEKDRAITLLVTVLEESLRLLHPLLPYITEEIYQKLASMNIPVETASIIVAPYPVARPDRESPAVAERFATIQELVRAVRTVRSEFTITPDKKIKVTVKAGTEVRELFNSQLHLISALIGAESLTIVGDLASHAGSVPVVGKGFEAFLYIKDVVDLPQEIAKLRKEQAKIQQEQERTGKKLANQEFVGKAPEEVVRNERNKLADFKQRLSRIDFYLNELDA